MTQLELGLEPMHAISLFCKLDGKMSRWDCHHPNVSAAIRECAMLVHAMKGPGHTVLAMIITPVANTSAE